MTDRRPITFEDIAALPAPGMNVPVDLKFRADGGVLTYLYSSAGTLTRELWALDIATGAERRLLQPPAAEQSLTREEELRRERQRQQAGGVTGYAWSETGDVLLVRSGGAVFVRRGATGELLPVGDGPGVVDPRLNRDGSAVAYVQDGELYVQDIMKTGQPPRRLTWDASAADTWGDRVRTNGLAEFVAQEEMHRFSGFWWSPDGDTIAFEQADSSQIPLYVINHPGTDDVQMEAHRYPFAGNDNARWRLGVVRASGGDVRWLASSDDAEYLARVQWTPDGHVVVQLQSRDQRSVEVRRYDPVSGRGEVLWAEQCDPWVNLTDDLHAVQLPDAARHDYTFIWTSERTGKRELYRYGRDGSLQGQISQGHIFIDEVRSVDAAGGWVYVEGWRTSPVERQLFRINLAGGRTEQITQVRGTHRTVIAPQAGVFADLHHSLESPPRAALLRLDGAAELAVLQRDAPADDRLATLNLPPPQLVEVATRDGETLHAAVYRPGGLAPGHLAPVVVDVYGGPHAQQVADAWSLTVDLRAQHLAASGFVVFVIDNRGSARRGLRFEAPIAGNLGDLEVRDQVDGVRALCAQFPEADAARVGIYGWSYGGYLALMCLARAADVFKAAVAGAPVTHWDGYDTHYTERYMGHPEQNEAGYRISAVMTHAAAIRGPLLIVHGMIDENVHFRHSGRLVGTLIHAGIPHETLFFPEERHGPRREQDKAYLERHIAEFFGRALRP